MKKYIKFVVLALFILQITGCASSQKSDADTYKVFYVDKDNTKIDDESYKPTSLDKDAMIKELIDLLGKNPSNVDDKKLLGGEINITKYQVDGEQLSLVFNEAYSQMKAPQEVLFRMAVVKSMLQVPGISCVTFFVGEKPLADSKGTVVGLMSKESFVENPGKQINAIQTATIHLFFPNKSGNALVETTQKVQYSSNVSMEKLVMENLLAGPKDDGMVSAIPDGTGLVSIATTNGVCYVNLDEGFLNQKYEIQEPIVIYSIVDSLSEIPNVNQVQISVNGDTSGVYRDSYQLSTLYKKNLGFVINSQVNTETDTEIKE
jgi:germination protein M